MTTHSKKTDCVKPNILNNLNFKEIKAAINTILNKILGKELETKLWTIEVSRLPLHGSYEPTLARICQGQERVF